MNTFNISKIFIVYNRAIAKARKTGDAKLMQRIHKAFGILQHHDYYVQEKALYNPTPTTCNCKDWEYAFTNKRGYKGHCKHMIAEILMSRVLTIKYKQLDFLSMVK